MSEYQVGAVAVFLQQLSILH